MKEVIQQANDFVIQYEDKGVNEMFENVGILERRAKLSHTLIAQKEYESAKQRLSDELERIGSPIPNGDES